MKLSVCATLISLSLMVGCQSTSLPSTDSSTSISIPEPISAVQTPVQVSESYEQICPKLGIQPVTVSVSDFWSEGEVITDAYSGNIAPVKNGTVTLTPSRHSGGVLLLESQAKKSSFDWHSATFYYVATDRFYNGNSWNDHSYGRQESKYGFKGGDIAGLTQKLDYLAELGVDVLWISTPLEQVHGWLPSEYGNNPVYPYVGGSTLDWTELDTNMGSEQEMRAFVDLAHQLGMKVIWSMDTEPSKPTLADLQQFDIQPNQEANLPSYWNEWQPKEGENLTHYLDEFKDENGQVSEWWPEVWFTHSQSKKIASENTKFNDSVVPEFFFNKPTTKVTLSHQTKDELLTQWITSWVTEFGIDGIVLAQSTPELTYKIEQAGNDAFKQWKESNPYKAVELSSFQVIDLDKPNHSIVKSFPIEQYQQGCLTISNYQEMEQSLPSLTTLTWFDQENKPELSSGNYAQYRDSASALLLSEGSALIWYGDESAKSGDIYSEMNWDEMTGLRLSLQSHWKKLLAFRSNHSSLSNGEKKMVKNSPYYAFTRENSTDKVMVVYTGE